MKNRQTFIMLILLIPLMGYSKEPNWEIVTLNHKLYQNVVFNQLSGDTLVVQAYGKPTGIPIDSIQAIRDVNGSHGHSVLGFIVGAIGGGIVGNSLVPSPKYGLDHFIYSGSGIILGSLVGVVVGASIKTNEFYPFDKMDHAKKIEVINQIMQPYAIKPIFGGKD